LSLNPNSNSLAPDRPQHDSPTACVIAQQYSSATFVSLLSHSHQKIFGVLSKMLFIFTLFKIV
jgi:hypothetical protein